MVEMVKVKINGKDIISLFLLASKDNLLSNAKNSDNIPCGLYSI